MIPDKRMDELIARANQAATRTTGGGDGSPLREHFSEDVFRATLEQLVANERLVTVEQLQEKR